MAINLLPRDYQNELNGERVKRFIVVAGLAVFLIIAVNILLLSPLWFLFVAQEKELARELEALKHSQTFLDITDIESKIAGLDAEVENFLAQEKNLFKLTPVIGAILDHRPAGIGVSGLSYVSADKNKGQPSRISISGIARSREDLLNFFQAGEKDPIFKKVNSPISNLLKEADFDYSLVFDLNN